MLTLSTLYRLLLTPLVALTLYTGTAHALDPLQVTVFIHDDVPEAERPQLHSDYFQAWAEEMKAVTGRDVQIEYLAGIAPFSSLDYQQVPEAELVSRLTTALGLYLQEQGINRRSFITHKFLLVTQSTINAQVLGISSRLMGSIGLASRASYSVPGHELGHLFNASHDRAEVMFNGWWCESYSYSHRMSVRSNCYRYSDANRDAIRAYVSEAP